MKNCLYFLLLVLALSGCSRQSEKVYVFSYFTNNGEDGLHLAYSEDGFKWQMLNDGKPFLKPELSKDKLMRDPCIIRGGDNRFHMVWTVSWNEKSIGYASSTDLVHWSEQQMIPVMVKEEKTKNCWAPEITYDAENNIYMIYWASTIEGKFTKGPTSEDKYNHRMYYVTTSDFKTFSETKLLYDPGFNIIDASIVPIDGKFVMFFKDETLVPPQKNIHIACADSLTGPYSYVTGPITGNYWAEGPTCLALDDSYLVYFDKYMEGCFGAIQSSDLKTWTDISSQIVLPEGIRHGSILTITKSEFEKLLDEINKK